MIALPKEMAELGLPVPLWLKVGAVAGWGGGVLAIASCAGSGRASGGSISGGGLGGGGGGGGGSASSPVLSVGAAAKACDTGGAGGASVGRAVSVSVGAFT